MIKMTVVSFSSIIKRAIKLLLCCILISSVAFDHYANATDTSAQLEESDFVLGDVDGDKNITASDARLALRKSAKLENFEVYSAEFKAADVNFDGIITASDARSILRASAKLETLEK